MNKKELTAKTAAEAGVSVADTEKVLAALIRTVQTAVASDDKVSITGFGAFEMVHNPARTGRHPQTGDPLDIAESWTPKFRPGSDFKELVNTGGQKASKKDDKSKHLVDA